MLHHTSSTSTYPFSSTSTDPLPPDPAAQPTSGTPQLPTPSSLPARTMTEAQTETHGIFRQRDATGSPSRTDPDIGRYASAELPRTGPPQETLQLPARGGPSQGPTPDTKFLMILVDVLAMMSRQHKHHASGQVSPPQSPTLRPPLPLPPSCRPWHRQASPPFDRPWSRHGSPPSSRPLPGQGSPPSGRPWDRQGSPQAPQPRRPPSSRLPQQTSPSSIRRSAASPRCSHRNSPPPTRRVTRLAASKSVRQRQSPLRYTPDR